MMLMLMLMLMLMFGFEVDTMEVHLREVAEVVDVIFIVEATVSHHGVRTFNMLQTHLFSLRRDVFVIF